MITRRTLFAFAATFAVAGTTAAVAAMTPFGTANFEAALKKGPVVAHVDATWCPTCRAQKPILSKLLADPKFKGVTAFTIDYDSEKPTLRELNAPDRSTIIVFVKGKEVARSVADTSEDKIAALLDKAL